MYSQNKAIEIVLDPSWSSTQVSAALLSGVRDYYGDTLDVDRMHTLMDAIWVSLQNDLTEEELMRVREVSHVSLPVNDLKARIATPPSRLGYHIIFDALLDLRLAEVFTAPRDIPSWCTAYMRAAWGNVFNTPNWVGPALERAMNVDQTRIPDSYSLQAARDFIFAHECGHLLLNHLNAGSYRTLHFGGEELLVHEPGLKQEIQADAFARELLCRSSGRPLLLQQKGVDWLFGFLGAVLGMRQRVRDDWAGEVGMPTMDEGMALRRRLCWDDYTWRREQSPNYEERLPENAATVYRLRESVDNFNAIFPQALADIYSEFPDELMGLHVRAAESVMTEGEDELYRQEFSRLYKEAQLRRQAQPWRQRTRRRLRRMVQRLF